MDKPFDKSTAKRVYTPPQIVRVHLNPEQAVLSQCSVAATSVLNNILQSCENPNILDMLNCTKSGDGGAQDSAATS